MRPWPDLDDEELRETYQTLHRWVQIVGKVRLTKTPCMNHSWHSTLYVTPSGLTTSAIPHEDGSFSVDFDFIDHSLRFTVSDGTKLALPLRNESVAAFSARFNETLLFLGINAAFDPHPNELPDAIPFFEDTVHATYIPEQAHDLWKVLVRTDQVLRGFRSEFLGKCSPVHFFWGSFDLAVTRFSGRPAPEHPGGVPHLPDDVTKEAYSHEVSSCGFWPGNDAFPHAAFYSYAYPEPPGFREAHIEPPEAFYHSGLREFILPYEAVHKSPDPGDLLRSFFRSTYIAAADLGSWDRAALEESPFLQTLKRRSSWEGPGPSPFF